MSDCSDRVRCGGILVQHYCMHVAHNAIVRIAAMTMQRVLIDLMTLDICGMVTRTLADRVAGRAEII